MAEIVDRAQKEEKMELGLARLTDTWSKVAFVFTPAKTAGGGGGAGGGDVHTAKMAEEDFEALEEHQVLVQGMASSRYVAAFKDDVQGWARRLMAVSDVVGVASDVQRTWAYLESLFVASEEVRRELPDAAARFAAIDTEVMLGFCFVRLCFFFCCFASALSLCHTRRAPQQHHHHHHPHQNKNTKQQRQKTKKVRAILAGFRKTPNVVAACNADGLLRRLEGCQTALEGCKKALDDFMESKRRAFPRFYFTSKADLLDILANGNSPAKVLFVFCCCCCCCCCCWGTA